MNATEVLIDLATRPLIAAEQLRPALTPERLNAHPHHDNSIAWLLWHAAREIDEQLSQLSGAVPLWTAQGFDVRFDLEVEPHHIGYGHSSAEARAIVVTDPDLLVSYLSAVVGAQVEYLRSLSETALDDVIDAQWDPPVTRGVRLVSISADALAHVEQAAYLAGMGAGAFEPAPGVGAA
ncbi:mycothiol transferase [Leucobacter sp. M11]|uniref:mycothiol transferase n=1 Tax=Leucobacter sp. M11 TaxID=2993565 RepID=UPI002D807B69|nr:aspartate/tyrosine/aromatic aminotransferase [Leucobacter sp. M11]MEB4616393.1 aspartate/tyrosine/aromatic aminotransferase [Leucobacter sp. M11]